MVRAAGLAREFTSGRRRSFTSDVRNSMFPITKSMGVAVAHVRHKDQILAPLPFSSGAIPVTFHLGNSNQRELGWAEITP
jgi:hypothetical protein